jgi:hypothetical protein
MASLDDLGYLTAPRSARDWHAHWFHRHLLARRLRPSCHVSYLRTAFVGRGEQGPLRLTIDRQLACAPHIDLLVPPALEGRALVADQAILELKFSTSLPVLFRRLVYELSLAPSTLSKYRTAVLVSGMVSAAPNLPRVLLDLHSRFHGSKGVAHGREQTPCKNG